MTAARPCPRRSAGALASAAILALTLAACDSAPPAPAGGVSKGEAEALAAAAEMLDETRQLPDAALPETAAPAAELTGDTTR